MKRLIIVVVVLMALGGVSFPSSVQASGLSYREVLRLWVADDLPKTWKPSNGPAPKKDILGDSFSPIHAFSWSPDGQRLAVITENGTVWIWDIATAKVISRVVLGIDELPKDYFYVNNIVWSPDGKWIAARVVNRVYYWNAEGTPKTKSCDQGDEATNLAWTPDSRYLTLAPRPIYIKSSGWYTILASDITRCAIGTEPAPPFDPGYFPDVLAYNPDGSKLAAITDSYDYIPYLRIYNTTTRQIEMTLGGYHDVAWSPDGKWLATIMFGDGVVQIRDTVDYLPQLTIKGDKDIRLVTWHPHANRLIVNGNDASLLVYDAVTGKRLATIANTGIMDKFTPYRGVGLPDTVHWSPDGSRLAVKDAGGFVRLYTESGKVADSAWPLTPAVPTTLPLPPIPVVPNAEAHPAKFRELERFNRDHNQLHWSPDGKVRVLVEDDPFQKVSDLSVANGAWENRQTLIRITDPNKWTFSPDGSKIALASCNPTTRASDPGGLTILSIDPIIFVEPIHNNACVMDISWSPDGKWIAGIVGDKLSLWDAASKKPISFLPLLKLLEGKISWSPDSQTLAIHDGWYLTEMEIFSVNTNGMHKVMRIANATGPTLRWSPEGSRLAVAVDNGLVRVWDVRTTQLLDTVKGYQSVAGLISWSPDGRYVASSSSDIEISNSSIFIIRDVIDHQTVYYGDTLTAYPLNVDWNPTSTKLVVSEIEEGQAQIIDVQTGQLKELIKNSSKMLKTAFSVDHHWFAYVYDAGIRIADSTTYEIVAQFPITDYVDSLIWSPDGSQLMSTGTDNHLIVWGIH